MDAVREGAEVSGNVWVCGSLWAWGGELELKHGCGVCLRLRFHSPSFGDARLAFPALDVSEATAHDLNIRLVRLRLRWEVLMLGVCKSLYASMRACVGWVGGGGWWWVAVAVVVVRGETGTAEGERGGEGAV